MTSGLRELYYKNYNKYGNKNLARKTLAEHADEYFKYIQETGVADYQNTEGNLSVKILRKLEDNICHFWTVTEWENIDSIKSFAGEDYEKARYYPIDKKYLLDFEYKVLHCETFTINKPVKQHLK